MAEALDREEYKERMRAAGRRALEEFRRQKGAAARSRGALPGLGTEVKAAHSTDRLPTVELTTFRVLTQPAAATAGPIQQHEPAELHMLTPAVAMASTSVGVLPPGSSCLPPFASSPCSITSGIRGAASVSSLASTITGFATPAPSAGIGTGNSTCGSPGVGEGLSVGPDLGLGGRSPGAVDKDDAQLSASDLVPCAGGSGSRSAATADPFVDMLLMQVQALAREKASLAAENAGLRQQVDQLEELVGVLLAERSLGEAGGSGAEFVEGGYETEGSYFLSPSRPQQELGNWQEPVGSTYELFESEGASGEADSVAFSVRPLGEVEVGTSGRGVWTGADPSPTGRQGASTGHGNRTRAACFPEREEDREHQASRGPAMEVGRSSRFQEASDVGSLEGLGSSTGEDGQQASVIGDGLDIPREGAPQGPPGHLDCGG
ncbi:hypothetical protein Vretimale_520 [Volvox reticuliferus]|uniref:Uncharacterized protein n=1 Tax=Volvox reticuliferus TaxID=1737510 RepID=A0A8J4FYG4_9CHLO|nr:hypothetical protein Vretimale_520 [Volvox reticuliferus]